MTSKTHESLVAEQFGPRAAAYVASSVHAQGEDLEYLVSIVRGQQAARVLDLGCGGGHVSFQVAPHVAEVVAYDLSADMLAAVAQVATERGLRTIVPRQGPAEQLPFEEAAFDFVFSRYSAHHWHGFDAGLGEARRVLKPGGRAVFMDVVSPGPALLDTYLQGVEWLRDPSHVRDYSPDEWQQALRRAGFVPGATARRRLRMDFPSWVARMRTPETHIQAIRSLQSLASRDVVEHFAIEPDGSFTIDTMTLEATRG
jgi:ubiquinone/menaquinone biosynthesis C-methylase UbiE